MFETLLGLILCWLFAIAGLAFVVSAERQKEELNRLYLLVPAFIVGPPSWLCLLLHYGALK